MSGAGPARPLPAKLRRLHSPAGTEPPAGPQTSPPAGGREGVEATTEVMADLETSSDVTGGPETSDDVTVSVETSDDVTGGLETSSDVTGGPQTSDDVTVAVETSSDVTGGLETSSDVAEVLETHNDVTGVLETSSDVIGVLETSSDVTGGLETSSDVTGGLETSSDVTGELVSSSDVTESLEPSVSLSRGTQTTIHHEGGLETAVRPKGGTETTIPRCSDQGRSRKRGLETPRRSPGPALTRSSVQRKGERGLETTAEPEGGLETTAKPKGGLETTATYSEQGRNGKTMEDPASDASQTSPEEHGVVSLGEEEEEEDEEEEGEEEEDPGRYLAALEAVQQELEALEEEAARAFRRLRAQFRLRRRPHLQRRHRLIQHIPGFWVTTFLNHPQLSAAISDRDEDALSYMTSLQVEEFGQAWAGCRIRFGFGINPYFQNRVVAKEFVRGPSGHLVSHSTPIRWWAGQDPHFLAPPKKGSPPPSPPSFFSWFGDHASPAGDRIAEIIKEELWPNPLHFYLRGEGHEEGTPGSNGGDSVVILDDDEEVQEIPDDGDSSGVEEVLSEAPPSPPDGWTDPKLGGRGN